MVFGRKDKKKAAPEGKKKTPSKKQAAKKKEAAEKKAAKKQAAPAQPKAVVGATSGVGVSQTWIRVFEENEQRDEPDRWTDKQISEFMKSEFPDMDALLFDRVEIARGKYNRGGFHKKDKSGKVVRPKIHSNQHSTEAGSSPGGRPAARTSSAAPVKDRVVSHNKDFKSHKK